MTGKIAKSIKVHLFDLKGVDDVFNIIISPYTLMPDVVHWRINYSFIYLRY